MPAFILLSILTLMLSACAAPVMMFGGVAGTGVTLSKQKTVGSSVDDTNIWTKIKAAFLQHHKEVEGILTNISVEVSEGRVLLTGHVNSVDDRLKILQLVWDQAGVKEVINEIKTEEYHTTFSSYSTDVWITTQVKSKFLAHKEIRSLNYNVETIDTIVYILGIAGSETELSQVLSEAESVKKVTKVVNLVRVKGTHPVSTEEGNIVDEKAIPEESAIKQSEKPVEEPAHKAPKEAAKTSSHTIEEHNIEDEHIIEIGQDD